VDSQADDHKVNLTQYRRVNGRWQFVPVVKKDGKPNPKLVLIGGEPASYKGGGDFYLDWREGGRRGKRKRSPVGDSPRAALDAWHQATGEANGSIEPEPDLPTDGSAEGVSVDVAIAQYLKTVKATKGGATYSAYSTDLRWARRYLTRNLVSRIDRNDLIDLFAAGRKAGLNQKTINKRVTVTLQMVRNAGHDIKLRKGDWPKTADKQIEIYLPDELKRFFAACSEDEKVLFQIFLCTGFRAEEVATLTWPDIHYAIGKICVTAKTEWRFTPKSYEIRSVEVPSGLLATLRERQKKSQSLLVFPAPKHPTRPDYGGDGVDAHLLEACKRIALRAGLNCGKCKGTYTIKRSATRKEKIPYTCKTSPRCAHWFLHKWRHTFASNMLPVVGLKKLQIVLGHKDIATTQKYLHLVGEDEVREKVEQSALAAYV
jgi:integrase/recombinase XerD